MRKPLAASRAPQSSYSKPRFPGPYPQVIHVRRGVHVLEDTVKLGPQHSNTIITAHRGEHATVRTEDWVLLFSFVMHRIF